MLNGFFDKNSIGYFAIVDIEIEMKLIRFMSLFKNIGKNSLIAHLHYLGIHYTIILGDRRVVFFYKLLKIHTGVGGWKNVIVVQVLQVRVHEFLVSKYQSTWQDIWYIRSRKQEPLETQSLGVVWWPEIMGTTAKTSGRYWVKLRLRKVIDMSVWHCLRKEWVRNGN